MDSEGPEVEEVQVEEVQVEDDPLLEYQDTLTGLYDRRYWTHQFPVLSQWAVQHQAALSMALLEIDNLLPVNGRFGHSVGNLLLAQIADTLAIYAEQDADHFIPVRYSGDRFAIVMPGLAAGEALQRVKELAQMVRETPIELPDGPTMPSISVGVSNCPEDTVDPRELMHFAEQALEFAVRTGRDRVCSPTDLALLALDKQKLHLLFPTPNVFGRAPLMEHLLQSLDTPGSHPLMLIYGPRGSGTSRLITELHRATKKRLSRVDPVLCRCLPFMMAQPFGVLSEGLQLAVSHDFRMREQMLSYLSASERSSLGRVLPQWSRQSMLIGFESTPVVGDPLVQLEDIFVKMFLAINQPPRQRVLALLVEDAQWLDAQTLHVIQKLKLAEGGGSAFIALAVRSHDDLAASNRVLQDSLQRLHEAKAVEFQELPPLSREEIVDWLHEVMPRLEVPHRVADLIHQRSSGLPLLVEEIVKFLIHEDYLRVAGDRVQFGPLDGSVIPENLSDLLFGHHQTLDAQMVRVLALGAMLGRPFSREEIGRVDASLPADSLDALLGEAVAQHLLRLDEGHYSFATSATSDSYVAMLPPHERRGLYTVLAEAEERRLSEGAEVQASDAAHVASLWRSAGDAERAAAVLKRISGADNELVVLDPQQVEAVFVFLRDLRLALEGVRNYGSDSVAIAPLKETLFTALSVLLAQVPALGLAPRENGIIVNGREIPFPRGGRRRILEDFCVDMARAALSSLWLHAGISDDEVLALLELMATPRLELHEKGGWSAALEERHLEHVTVNRPIRITMEDASMTGHTVRRLLGVEASTAASRDGRLTIRDTLGQLLARLDETVDVRRLYAQDADRFAELLKEAHQRVDEAINMIRKDA
ncbi:MAG: diguanylate cyclase [Candidatus Xenobia bacterium]